MTVPTFYLANAGVPLFSQGVFYQTLLLIPIIAIEAYVHRQVMGIKLGRAVWVSLSANVISTLGGIVVILPLGALLGHLLLGTTVPVSPGAFPMVPLEIAISLLPLFVFTVLLERFIGVFSLHKVVRKRVRRSFLLSNGLTYLILEGFAIALLLKGFAQSLV
ncbi:MAG: hypothetical protein AAFQ74_03565 [Cyanobacteria bacterium J06623_4]